MYFGKQMDPHLREEWAMFLEGVWTSAAPTEPGRYHISDRNGRHCGSSLLVLQTEDGLLYVLNGRKSPTPAIIWGGSFWSAPEPDLSAAPVLETSGERP